LELADYFKLESTSGQSFLEHLLTKSLSNSNSSFKDSSSQTIERSSVSDIENQLLDLDLKFAGKKSDLDATFDEKLLKIQKECESRMKLELDHQIKRVREIEIVNLKLEEANKYQELLKRYKDDCEKRYLKDFENLKNKEKKLNDMIRAKESELDNKAFAQRQDFLLNMEKNNKNTLEIRRKIVLEEEEVQNLKETWKSRVKDLEEKNKSLEIKEKELQLAAKEEFLRFKLEFESKFEDEKRKLALQKVELEALKKELDIDSDRLKSNDRFESYSFEVQKLRTENRVLKEQNSNQGLAVDQLRNELKLISDTQNHLINQINLKEGSIQILESELQSFKTLAAELKASLEKEKKNHLNEKEKILMEAGNYGNFYAHEFLVDHRFKWNKIHQEEMNIKREFFDLIKPSTKIASPGKETGKIVQGTGNIAQGTEKIQANVTNYLMEYENDSSSSRD
jgi:hypothetical protein